MHEEYKELGEPFLIKKRLNETKSKDTHAKDGEDYLATEFLLTRRDSANENWHSYILTISEGDITGSVFCLLCLTFGSAILALPYSITKTGVILGFALFFFASLTVLWTLRMLIKVAIKNASLNYSNLIFIYFGKNHTFFYELMNLSSNLGTIVIYQQIISNFVLSSMKWMNITQISDYPNLSRFIQMNVLALLTQVPITFIKQIEVLYKISYLGTLALLYSVIVAIIEFPYFFSKNYSFDKILWFKFDWNVIKVICVYFFAFANHNAILNVLSDLKNPNKKRCIKVLNYSFNIEFYTYLIVIIVGYFSTYQETNEIFVDRMEEGIFMVVGKLLYVFSLSCHIGLYYYISRPSLEVLFNKSQQFSDKQNTFYGVFIILLLNFIAYAFKSIINIISFFGATVNIYLVFIMPILLYLKCTEQELEKYKLYRILAIVLLIVSCSISSIYVISLVFETFVDVY